MLAKFSAYIARSGMSADGQNRVEVATDALRQVICEETMRAPKVEPKARAAPKEAPETAKFAAKDKKSGD